MGEASVDVSAMASTAEELRGEGATVIFMAADNVVVGLFAIADPIKATTSDAVRTLVNENVRVVMLTGDNRTTAEAVGAEA